MATFKDVIIFGTGDLAAIAKEYFDNDSNQNVVAFTVDKEHARMEHFMGLPVIPFEDIDFVFPPSSHEVYCALVYNNMNRDRAEVCKRAKAKGYKLASYISSHAFVSPSAKIGEHAFIFEGNVIQPFVEIGDNAILWSGNHVGHNSCIGDNVFISSHVVVSGHCNIGDNVFMGVNSTLANNTTVGCESWINHASVLSGDIPEHSFVKGSEIMPLNEEVLSRALKKASTIARGGNND